MAPEDPRHDSHLRRVTDQDETWLAQLGELSPDAEVSPGLTVSDLARFHARPPTPPGCVFRPDVAYGAPDVADVPARRLDVYCFPDGPSPRAGVLFVHGGSWAEGHRYAHIRRACLLARSGWVAATMSYRLSGEATWPAPLEDVTMAWAWMRANAGALGLDPGRLAVAGNSAGGQLAAMAALAAEGPAAAVLWYPVVDLGASAGLRPAVRALLGGRRRRLGPPSPVNHVRAGAPPVITFTGDADDLVPVESVVRFHRELSSAGVTNELHVYPGAGHAFDFHPDAWADSFDKARAFLERVLGPPC